MPDRESLLELNPDDLSERLQNLGEPSYRSRQILEWTYRAGALSFTDMTNLPRALRQRLERIFIVRSARQITRSEAPDGTMKLLLAWPDGHTTETVMIPARGAKDRRTACLSTQVGCDVGCRFCASGIGGSARNLTVGEVVEQALAIRDLLRDREDRLSHVVFMGMGEPLVNYAVTVEAIRRLNAPWGLAIAQRRITLSTVGLPKQIERLASEELQITLALSLHAPNDDLRRRLIPWAEKLPLERLLEACQIYRQRTGREITLEYCLLAAINDRETHARELAAIARRLRAHVNLLMYNPVEGLPFARPARERAVEFLRFLRAQGIKASLRESRGLQTDAACGQLRRRTSPSERQSVST